LAITIDLIQFVSEITMRQMTFTSIGFQIHYKRTMHERLLSEMETFLTWRELCSLCDTNYPSGQRGRPLIAIDEWLEFASFSNG
jgi:hypothetical protein